jgi:hypothetical protein
MDPITIGLTVGSGVLSYFSKNSEYEQRKKMLDKYLQHLETLKIRDKGIRVDRIGDAYNTGIAKNVNTTGLRFATAGILNPQTTKALMLGAASAGRQTAMINEASRVDQYNRQIEEQMASAEMQMPTAPTIADALPAALSGMKLGMAVNDNNEFNSLIKNQKINTENFNSGVMDFLYRRDTPLIFNGN